MTTRETAERGRITRDTDVPERVGELFQAFNHVADGYTFAEVMEATANVLAAAIDSFVQERGGRHADARNIAEQVFSGIRKNIEANWLRQASPDDIEVPHGH